MEEIRVGCVLPHRVKGLPGFHPHRVGEGRRNVIRVVQRRVGQHLMEVGPVGFAQLLCHPAPTFLVDLDKVSLVLRVNDTNGTPTPNDNVRSQVAERSEGTARPVERKDGLPQAAHEHISANESSLPTNHRLDPSFPEHIKRELPRKAVLFAPAAKPALVNDPRKSLDPPDKGLCREASPIHLGLKSLAARHQGHGIREPLDETNRFAGQRDRHRIPPPDYDEIAMHLFEGPADVSPQDRVRCEIWKTTRNPSPLTPYHRFVAVLPPEDPPARLANDFLTVSIAGSKGPKERR